MDFTLECLLNILEVTDPQRRVVARTQIQISVSKQQLEWTNPNVFPNHLAPNFPKSQMVSIFVMYVNGVIVSLLFICPASGMGFMGGQGHKTQNSK